MESPEEEIEGDNNVRCSVELVDDAADNDHEIDSEVITDSELVAILEEGEMKYPINNVNKLNKNNDEVEDLKKIWQEGEKDSTSYFYFTKNERKLIFSLL